MCAINKSDVKVGFEEISVENLFAVQGGEEDGITMVDTIKRYLIKLFGIGENTNN